MYEEDLKSFTEDEKKVYRYIKGALSIIVDEGGKPDLVRDSDKLLTTFANENNFGRLGLKKDFKEILNVANKHVISEIITQPKKNSKLEKLVEYETTKLGVNRNDIENEIQKQNTWVNKVKKPSANQALGK